MGQPSPEIEEFDIGKESEELAVVVGTVVVEDRLVLKFANGEVVVVVVVVVEVVTIEEVGTVVVVEVTGVEVEDSRYFLGWNSVMLEWNSPHT